MDELLQLIFKTYGLIGILILAPFIAVVYLWRDNKSMQLNIQKANDQALAVQAQRVTDAQTISGKLIEMVAEQSSLNKETNIVLERISDWMSSHNNKE